MKMRKGFVSNSSSSSFVIFLPKIENIEDMYKHIGVGINDINKTAVSYDCYDEVINISVNELMQRVYDDVSEAEIADLEALQHELASDVYHELYLLEDKYGSNCIMGCSKGSIDLPQEFHEMAKANAAIEAKMKVYRTVNNFRGLFCDKDMPEDERKAKYKKLRDYEDELTKKHKCTYDNKDEIIQAEARRRAEKLLDENAGLAPYVLTYGDDDGQYFAALEHGGGLEKYFNARRVSNH